MGIQNIRKKMVFNLRITILLVLSNSVIDPETKISKNICRKEEKIELNSADGSAVN
jgi:hypothetical protein